MLFSRDLHVLLLPQSVNPFGIHSPVTGHEQPMNPLRPKAWTLPGQGSHFTQQPGFIIRPSRLVSLSAARLPQHSACASL